MPWEFSAVRLTNLPRDFNSSTIAEHFHHRLGIQVPEVKIDPQPMLGADDVADVTLDGLDGAANLLRALEDEGSAKFRGMPVVASHYRAARFNQISSSRVNCSWHKPSRTAWLSFGMESMASKVYRQFADGVFRVDGHRVLPERPTVNDGANASTWGLKLNNVPASSTRNEITEDIPLNLRPTHIELSRPSYNLPMEAAVNEITNMLMQVGPLDSSVVTSAEGQGRRYKLTARFVDANDASDAAKILNYKSLPFFGHGKLTVQQVYTVRVRVPDHIYLAAAQDIEALARYWTTQYINYTASPAYKNFRNIRIEGQSHEQVAEAQCSLESVMAGELLTEDGEPMWSPSFATNAWAYTQMRDLERRLGILVLRDRNQRTLRMLGPRDMFGPARLEIVKLCNQDPRQEFSVRIDSEALPWLLHGGYQHISRAVGVDKVGLDIASEQRRLIVSGSAADHSVAQDMYLNRSLALEPDVSNIGSQDCSLCGSLAEYPVFTRCRHLYCASCFEDMCISCAGTYVRTPAIRCYGDFGACRELLSLEAIQESITSEALERVFERMFGTFVGANSKQYRYCPTPNCVQVYRLDERVEGVKPEEFEFNCPQCQVAICSTCHVSHETVHCPLRLAAARGIEL